MESKYDEDRIEDLKPPNTAFPLWLAIVCIIITLILIPVLIYLAGMLNVWLSHIS